MDSTKKNMSSMESVCADILRVVQCPRCQKYLTQPITMCNHGHNICNRCQAHISPNDASCTGQPSDVRNVALEKILATAIYPCPFAAREEFRCDWSGMPFQIERHVENSHNDECIRVTESSGWICFLEPSYQKAIFTLGKLFFSQFSVSPSCVCGAVFHVGHKKNSSRYKYDFNIGNSQRSLSISGVTCYHYQDRMKVFQYRKCVYFTTETLTFLSDDSGVTCAFQIREENEGNQPMEWADIPPG